MSTNKTRRPWLAAFLTFLYPGLGHVYLRAWIRTALWFGMAVGSAAWLVPPEAQPESFSMEALTASAQALPLEVTLALMSVRLFGMIDAYWLAKRTNTESAVAEGTTCPNCGKDLDDDLDFCHWCTEPLPGAEDADADPDPETEIEPSA